LAELADVGDAVIGEKLVAVGRKIGRVHVIPRTSAHRVQSVYVWGSPAKCWVDVPVRRLR